ncbi:zinc ribbon domain-containing protein [uncultured Shewanella sp.]|uniref:zinc ribbon domain-containing protein n=1 Tax=uncultured Shewanella sp. TaxID=173975 RepID=UPI0026027EF8|nr:zinc ribbon domain-containing protein [uncultured Shewanella sp.]
MALILCSQCQQPISKDSLTCPLCGHSNSEPTLSTTETSERKISLPLLLGIIFIPYLFTWFILRKGYKLTSQAIALAWLTFMIYCLAIAFYDPKHHPLQSEQPVIIEIQKNQ